MRTQNQLITNNTMKSIFLYFLFLPTCLMAQNKEEKMPSHNTITTVSWNITST